MYGKRAGKLNVHSASRCLTAGVFTFGLPVHQFVTSLMTPYVTSTNNTWTYFAKMNLKLVVVVVVVYWQKCGQGNRDTTRIAVKNKT